MAHILSLKINNNKAIELNLLTNSLNALAREYDIFTRDKYGYSKTDRKLEIKKLEQGSLIIELAATVIPQMQEVNTVLTFGKYLITSLNLFKTNNEQQGISKTTCNNLSNLVDIAANDSGSAISVQVNNSDNTNIYVGDYDSIACNAIQNNINKYQKVLSEEEPSIVHSKQAFYWFSASFANNSDTSYTYNVDKGIIEKFDKKPHKIIFENDKDKLLITSSNLKFNKDWQELMYVVDVEIITIQGVVKMYKILHVHYNDTIDPKDDE